MKRIYEVGVAKGYQCRPVSHHPTIPPSPHPPTIPTSSHHPHILPPSPHPPLPQTHRDKMDRLFGLKQEEGSPAATEEALDTVTEVEESELTTAGATLAQLIREHFPDLISDQRVNMYTYRNCCSGRRLVDWVISQSGTTRSRSLVVGMWQALLTEGVLQHGKQRCTPSGVCVLSWGYPHSA